MTREDLRSRIIPTTIGNTDASYKMGDAKFDTTDLIYLDSYDEQYIGKTDEERRLSATDYAIMTEASTSGGETRTGKNTTIALLRSAYNRDSVTSVGKISYMKFWHVNNMRSDCVHL